MDIRNMPLLTAQDVDVRVQQVTSNQKALVLLYKSARVDMRVLDEVFGAMNWKRHHTVIGGNLFCTIEVWDEAKKEWVGKEDVGVPSNTEAEKGQASDAFKRAGFCWGIGRELYDAPTIFIPLLPEEIKTRNGKNTTYARFHVSEIAYDRSKHVFTALKIIDEQGRLRWENGRAAPVSSSGQNRNAGRNARQANAPSQGRKPQSELAARLEAALRRDGVRDLDDFVRFFGLSSWGSMTEANYKNLADNYRGCVNAYVERTDG